MVAKIAVAKMMLRMMAVVMGAPFRRLAH
jgi:hypothetical protein